MSTYYQDASTTILHGDCIEVMRTMPDNSIDSIVTDPPYGLGFMGKKWDSLPPGEEWAQECLRVLKPGGHLIAFGGSRTWHRLAVAIEDAGFEIRDGVLWLYGSGFPKSHDISKAIDKMRVEDLEPTRVVCRAIRASMDSRGLKSKDLVQYFDGCHPRLIDHWAARDTDSQPALPKWDQWEKLREILDLGTSHDAEVWRLNGRKGTLGKNWDLREITQEGKGSHTPGETIAFDQRASTDRERRDIPATSEAQQWEGWGTALKPAYEPAVMARKPFTGTVARNVLEHGTGAINIDANRVGAVPQGRFPANLILDEHTAELLDEQSGTSKSSVGKPRSAAKPSPGWGMTKVGREHNDEGGASRFFYVAKAPKSERPVVDGVAHATVKPLKLMRYLVRMVTPPGGTVLEPFAGSGTTIEAALIEGYNVIGIERETEYLPLIQHRINRANGGKP